jgi:hypothetical protein
MNGIFKNILKHFFDTGQIKNINIKSLNDNIAFCISHFADDSIFFVLEKNIIQFRFSNFDNFFYLYEWKMNDVNTFSYLGKYTKEKYKEKIKQYNINEN